MGDARNAKQLVWRFSEEDHEVLFENHRQPRLLVWLEVQAKPTATIFFNEYVSRQLLQRSEIDTLSNISSHDVGF